MIEHFYKYMYCTKLIMKSHLVATDYLLMNSDLHS